MSETDSFIREVTEEVRQDRMLRYWKKYGPLIIGGIVLIVAIAAGLAWWQRLAEEQAASNGGLLLQAQEAAPADIQTITAGVEGGAQVIAQLRTAQATAAAGDRQGAAQLYDAIAEDQSLAPRYRDLARLEAVRLRATLGEPLAMLPVLDELAMPGAPFRPLALELRAALKLNAGDVAGARADLGAVVADATATGETRARVQALLQTLPPIEDTSDAVETEDGETGGEGQ
ncbi:MAG: tetratricopeptide repeat protein [Pseudomonadota bacterium]